MSHVDIARVSQIIREVALAEVMSRWQKLEASDVSYKSIDGKAGVGGPVTVADMAAEAALERQLTALLPGSRVVGEEGVAADPSRLDLFRSDGPIWVLDPIDGTRAYAKGKPEFDMMVALVVGGVPVAGWIYHPVSGAMYVGERGSGVVFETSDGAAEKVRVAPPRDLAAMNGLIRLSWPKDDPRRELEAKTSRFASLTEPRSSGRNYARILRGEVHFLMNFTPHPWDHLSGFFLLSELGHVYARADGTPYHPADGRAAILTAPTPALWSQVRDTLFDGGNVPC